MSEGPMNSPFSRGKLPINLLNILLTIVLLILILLFLVFIFINISGSQQSKNITFPGVAVSPTVTKTRFSPAVPSPTFVLPTQEPTSRPLIIPVEQTAVPTLPGGGIPSTPPLSAENITIILQDTKEGDFLIVSGGSVNYSYRLGPLAKGAYALGPNQKFIAYITNDGEIFAARIGNLNFIRVGDLKKRLMAVIKRVEPIYVLSFHEAAAYTLIIYERIFDEKDSIVLPRAITY